MRSYKQFVLALLSLVPIVRGDIVSDLQGHGFEVAVPGSEQYNIASSAYNLRLDSVDPTAITFPKSPKDVSEILKICSRDRVPAVARSGGHSYVANSLGGDSGAIVIDLSSFTQISVDDNSKIAAIGTGNRLGAIASGLFAKGRALPHGTCKMVGIGGHSSFGGYGFTSRKWGLTLDTVRSLDVVLSNGTIASLSSHNYPDLFWAFRGAGASFGVVTQTHVATLDAPPSSTVFVYTWDLTAEEAANALGVFQSHAQTPKLPQEYGAEITFRKGSAFGKVSFTFIGGWYGPQDQLQSVIQPVVNKIPGTPVVQLTPGSYLDSVITLDGSGNLDTSNVTGDHDTFFARSLTVPESVGLTASARKAFTTFMSNSFNTSTTWFCQVELYGGTNSAINNVPFDATSFGHRDAIFILQLYAFTPSKLPPFPQSGFDFVNGVVDSITNNSPPHTDFGAYANYIESDLPNWQQKYYGAHYPKLQQLKTKYDPTNTFRFPTSIELSKSGPYEGS
ncbi:glucooligosaccharide oxidase [Crepidotus variabilis]|uniref:Glucooligosaccharide oxidase n=1 Tax=Crepidotus variabilis TaxID=179855 RepID=A0A9P6E8S3_9AGAR|nr:glucooligosaccharide oxidase [Crepidotus variabilis]